MAVPLTHSQLPELLESLKNDDKAIQVRGEITAKLNHVITDYDVIVDQWPDYKAVVIRVNRQTAMYPVHLSRFVSVYSKDSDALTYLLLQQGIVDWDKLIYFVCVPCEMELALKTAIDHMKCKQYTGYYELMTVTKSTLQLRPIPDGFSIRSLNQDQAKLVNSSWKYNVGEQSEVYIQHVLKILPSCCLYNREGRVVGYALTYHYGAIGMLHVMTEFRRQGYGKVIVSRLASQCLQNTDEFFAFIEEDNVISIKLHQAIGFRKGPNSKNIAIVVNEN